MFNLLLSKGLCPVVCRLLAIMYVKQMYSIRWANVNSREFNAYNGVKQGGVLSPILFTIYMDSLLVTLSESGLGCYVGSTFVGALGYADDVILLSPSISALRQMLQTCEKFASDYDVIFNAKKSYMLTFNAHTNYAFKLNGDLITHSVREKHLGTIIGEDSDTKRIEKAINDIYFNCNKIIAEFNHVNIDLKYKLFKTYCMSLYGSPLFNYADKMSNKLFTAWRKALRHLLGLSPKTHCNLLHEVVNDIPVNTQLHKRVLKFAFLCTKNNVSNLMLKISLSGSGSVMCNNLNYICHEYSIDKWDLLNHVPKLYVKQSISPTAGLIRDLALYKSTCTETDRKNIDCILIDVCEN